MQMESVEFYRNENSGNTFMIHFTSEYCDCAIPLQEFIADVKDTLMGRRYMVDFY
jgi:hypothetical protein